MELKRCCKCKRWLELSNFGKRSRSKDGFREDCKDCVNRANRERYYTDPAHHNAITKRWQQTNAEKVNESQRKRRAANRDTFNARSRKYRFTKYHTDPVYRERVLNAQKRWYRRKQKQQQEE